MLTALGGLAQAHGENLERPVTHDLLDEVPPDRSLYYLRQTLVQTGVLPLRDEEIERVPAWLEHQLAGTPAGHARLIRPFLHWSLLRRARSLAVPAIPRQQPGFLGDDRRWALLQRCLTDEGIPAKVRAAGALVPLFGLPVQRYAISPPTRPPRKTARPA